MSLETKMKGTMDIDLDDYCNFESHDKEIDENKQEKDLNIEILFPEYC